MDKSPHSTVDIRRIRLDLLPDSHLLPRAVIMNMFGMMALLQKSQPVLKKVKEHITAVAVKQRLKKLML